MSIHDRCMLVSLTTKSWGGKRTDRKATKDFNEDHNAQAKAGVYMKNLIDPKASGLRAIQSLASTAVLRHTNLTAPWGERGSGRIITINGIDRWISEMREFRDKHRELVEVFLDSYEDHVATAKDFLGDLHDPADYPSVKALRRRFYFGPDYRPLPHSNDFRMTLDEDQKQEIIETIRRNEVERVTEAVDFTWKKLEDHLVHVAERLKAYSVHKESNGDREGFFRSTLISNLHTCLQVMDGLNIEGDTNLSHRVMQISNRIAVHDPVDLRENDALRAEVVREAERNIKEIRKERKANV